MYPPPDGQDLTEEQALELDDTFLASDPFQYSSRIASLLAWHENAPVSDAPLPEPDPGSVRADFNQYLHRPAADGPFKDLDVNAQVAADALAVRHHSAEALSRLACARFAPSTGAGRPRRPRVIAATLSVGHPPQMRDSGGRGGRRAHRICVDQTRGRDLAMGKTATALGQEFGRTAREMNKLLREHGFMEGDPGAYRPTALGEAFAQAVDFDNGYGGFAHRQWGWLSWTDGLIDALKASMEANPDGVVPPAAAPEAVFTNIKLGPAALRTGSRAGGQFLNKNGLVAVVVLAGLGASTPVARRAWHERVKPAASKVRARIAERKSTKGAGGADEHDSGK